MDYYAKTGPGYGIDKSNLIIRSLENQLIQRYDLKKRQWIPDVEMYQIYTGGIECEPITEQQANELVERLSQ